MSFNGVMVEKGLDRRVSARRASFDRRFAERRCPERAQLGRRTQFTTDRRVEVRRESDHREQRPRLSFH